VAEDAIAAWHEHMAAGDFEAAWRISDRVPPRIWRGTPLAGKRVLIRCENGLGDTIQFIRYAALLRDAGSRVTVAPQANLASLMPYVDGLSPGVEHEVEIECTELPYAFRTTIETVPNRPYINFPFTPVPRNGRRRVGLVWASGVYNPCRSVPLQTLAPLGSVAGVEWVSVQHGPGVQEAWRYGAPLGIDESPAPENDDALATARQIADLDLVITVDTMVAHLAGALRKPVWTLLPFEADWRWLRDRDDSPWYPTMRLFRQRRAGCWDDAVARIVSALGEVRQ